MSTALTHSLVGGIPLAFLVFFLLVYMTRKGPHPDTYKMSDRWTHEPILWAADEPSDHGHGGHDSHGVTVGGGASGKW